MANPRSRELARADRILPGLWRLRLPLPWPAVPHVNAYAVAAGSGVVLFDAGLYEPGALGQLERALDQARLKLEHVRLLVCTHAHADHYGLAGAVVEAAGCELWMHPNHQHMTRAAADPDRMLERRIEVAMQSGVPRKALEQYRESRRGQGAGVAKVVLPDRPLVDGVEVETDLGTFRAHETPGHAPSHVVLHEPERGVLISGDHLLGRVSLYYDWGYTPDPTGEFLCSMDVVEALDARLCVSGHGRPFRDVVAHIGANRRAVADRVELVRRSVSGGARTPYEIVPDLVGADNMSPMMVNWGLSEVLCYLRHLELRGEVERQDSELPERWSSV